MIGISRNYLEDFREGTSVQEDGNIGGGDTVCPHIGHGLAEKAFSLMLSLLPLTAMAKAA